MSPLTLALLALVGFVAGLANTLAGGGSLLTLPALIFAGVPETVANGTNRIGILVGSLTAIGRFRADPEAAPPPEPILWVPALLGALLGAYASVELDDRALRVAIGLVLVVALPAVLDPARFRPAARELPRWARALGFFAVGVYGGFIQAGVGILLVAAFVGLAGRDLVAANSGKVVIVAAYTVPALLLFILADKVAWAPGLAVAVGSAAGGWLGARLALQGGEGLIRPVLAIAMVAAAARLLGLV